jgi:hypothetical protein
MFGRTFLQAACGDVVFQLLIGITHGLGAAVGSATELPILDQPLKISVHAISLHAT